MDLSTKRCYLTSQNHSYAVDEKTLPSDWRVTFRNLNDQSVEGIEHDTAAFFFRTISSRSCTRSYGYTMVISKIL